MNYYKKEEVENIDQQQWAFIQCNVTNHLMTITLNRPAKKNAIHPHMVNEITFALTHCHHNNNIRCILLKANGDVFCSGADLKAFMGVSEEFSSSITAPSSQILMGELFNKVHKPIICELNGNIMAGGLFFITGSHFIVANNQVTFGLPEVKRGLFPFQVLAALLTTISKRNAINWCIKGDTIDTSTAMQWGLITHCVNKEKIEETVQGLIDQLSSNSPNAIRLGLEAFEKITKTDGEHQYLMEMLQKTIMSKDAKEGINAFKEKRNPVWPGE